MRRIEEWNELWAQCEGQTRGVERAVPWLALALAVLIALIG